MLPKIATPATPSRIRPSRLVIFFMRASWPSTLSSRLARTKPSMPSRFTARRSDRKNAPPRPPMMALSTETWLGVTVVVASHRVSAAPSGR